MIKEKLKNILEWVRVVLLLSIFPALLFGLGSCNYYWTKRSLEEISGKKVSFWTVVWAIGRNGGGK